MMKRATALAATGGLLVAAICAHPSTATTRGASRAEASSLPTVSSGHRPGPDILYAPPAAAPQLSNAPGTPWRAEPILVSGAAAYRRGEFLYQGYLFADHGGAGAPDPTDQWIVKFTYGQKTGTLSYPTGQGFTANDADLLELRTMPASDATKFRVTFNSMTARSHPAVTIALGTSAASHAWPNSAGVSSPARYFLTAHDSVAVLTDAATGVPLSPPPSVRVDLTRHQLEISVPHKAWNPGTSVVRMWAGAGLWDATAGSYLVPGPSATATHPGGVGPSQEAIFDLAFRFHEPKPDWKRMGLATNLADAAVVEAADQHCFWLDCQQGASLRTGDASPFFADVDYGKLAHRVDDETQVPHVGSMDRILASHFSFGQGVDLAKGCGRFPVKCHGEFPGNLQPYAIYIPSGPAPSGGWGLAVQLHASAGNHNEYMGSRNETQIGEVTRSIVITPLARDDAGDYTDMTEADVFEVWADVAHRFHLDPSRVVVTGYSMGGGGTYKLAERWPDLFAAAFGIAALPYDGIQAQWIDGLRNVPLLVWIGSLDEASPVSFQRRVMKTLHDSGLRSEWGQFTFSDHLGMATNDEYAPAAAWLANRTVVKDPPRITYVVDSRSDFVADKLIADHAYWLSHLTVRNANPAPVGAIDVQSLAYGIAIREQAAATQAVQVMMGGNHGPYPYIQTVQDWKRATPATPRDALVMRVTNLSSIEIDAARARISCHATVTVDTDGPLTITVPSCHTSRKIPAGHQRVTL